MFRFIRLGLGRPALQAATAALLLGFVPSGQTQSDPGYDWSVVGAHVISMELTYFPGTIPFVVDVNAGICGSGTWLNYSSSQGDTTTRAANMKAVLAAVMTAKASAVFHSVWNLTASSRE